MRIGLLGTGNVARALADGWSAAGHDVLLGSRRPKERTGLGLPVAGLGETAAHAEVLVNATPGAVSGGITTARGQEHFALLFMGIAGGLGAHTFNINVVTRPAA